MIRSEFYKKDLATLRKIISNLKSYENQGECSLSVCRESICSEYYDECDSCMFSYTNNIHGLACEDTVGVFDEMPISDIVKKLEFMYSQLYICELNSYKKFKSGGKNVI